MNLLSSIVTQQTIVLKGLADIGLNKASRIRNRNHHNSVNHNFTVFLSLTPVGFVLAAEMTGVFVVVPSLVL